MSERSERFAVPDDGCRVEVRVGSGDVRFLRGEPGAVEIALSGPAAVLERVTVEQRGGAVVVEMTGKGRRWERLDVVATVPDGIEADVKLGGGGDLAIDATPGSLRAAIGVGDVRVHAVDGDADLKAGSGDLVVGSVGGRLSAAGASGDVRVGAVGGDLSISVASGDVRVGSVGGAATVRTASGRIAIDRVEGPSVAVRTLAGDVTLGIPAGRTLEVDLHSLSGRVVNRLEPDPASPRTGFVRIEAKSVSGDVALVPARPG